ncbi:MAG: hypothetical protein PHE27_06740 [Alphaproteobacteria bacterium]|nr:hypothetical protein [Alphaproteobacteria bacterium]
MTDPTDDNDDEDARRKKKKDEGEGDSDSWGRGKAGSASGVTKVKRLSPEVLKRVMENWQHLDMAAVVQAVAEFFSDLPMRASANLSVAWEKTRSFAILNKLIAFGEKAAGELNLNRERERSAGKDTRGLRRRKGVKTPTPDVGPRPSGG